MTNFKEVKISEIFDLSINTNSSFFTKSFIDQYKWIIPVYSASKIEKIVWYWFIEDNVKWVKYFENCLTWNIDGSIWKVFYRKWKFSLSEKVIPLILFEKYEHILDKVYLKNIIELSSLIEWFWFTKKAWKSRIKDLFIKIPINENLEFDLEKQREIASNYEKNEKIKDRLRIMKEDLEDKNLIFKFIWNYEEVSINKIFDLQRWKSLYTKQYWNDNKWEFPVYSAWKEQLTSINTFDFDWEYLTWATNWFAWYLKRINWKFSINADRWIFIPKTQNIDIDFIKYSIQWDLRNLTKWRVWDKWKNEFTKLSPDKIKDNILVKIPVKENWEFDLEKQKEIALKYEKIEKIQKTLIEELEYLEKVKVEIYY